MSEPVQQNLKATDQGAEKAVQKTPEAVKDGGVIAAQPNQEVHGLAFANAHQNDKTLSEPDMIAMNDGETVAEYKARVAQIQANRFGFFDSEEEKENDAGAGVAGRAKIHERPAKQAVELIPGLSPTMQQAPFDSSVKVNVQITNVPEVSEAVRQEVLGKYAEAVLENAAAAVRQVENHLAQPNAINSDFQKIGQLLSEAPGHFAQSPEQLNKDVSAVVTGAMEEIDKPLSVDERAQKAGMLLPMFFFEGGKEPINPETIEQMGLEGMTEAELKALGIEKRVEVLEEGIAGKSRTLEERDIVNPINRSGAAEEKLAQLQRLSQENEPLVRDFADLIDSKYGTKSQIGLKEPADIAEKASRPSIKADKPWFDIEHIRDSLRFKTVLQDLRDMPRLVEDLKESGFEVIKCDAEKLLTPKGRGWRMAAFDLRAPNGQIIEYQILPPEMEAASAREHQIYKQWRKVDFNNSSKAERQAIRKADTVAKDMYEQAWKDYLKRTGQTDSSINQVVKSVNEKLEGQQ